VAVALPPAAALLKDNAATVNVWLLAITKLMDMLAVTGERGEGA
jgi:hypothetical protein